MFPYENVKSIHNQKMAQFIEDRSRKQLKQMVRAGRPSPLKRLGDAAGDVLIAMKDSFHRVRPAL